MNTKRTWASRVLACIIDRKSRWFPFRQGANCEAGSLVWSTIECDTGLATSYEGSSGCRGPILCISRGAIPYPMFPLHLDADACPRGQVGVWHSDAVMQPGPRDGRGSTNGAPTGWLMIVLATVRRRVPKKRIYYCGHGMSAGYGPAIGMKAQAKGETRPDQTRRRRACMQVNRERRQAWAEQSKLNLDRHGAISNHLPWREGLGYSLYRETYARPRSLRNGQQCFAL